MNSSFSFNRWTSIKTLVRKNRMIDLKSLSAIPIIQDFVLVIHTILPSAPNFFFFFLRCTLKLLKCFLLLKRNSWKLLSGEIIDSIKKTPSVWNTSQMVHYFGTVYECLLIVNNCISQWIDLLILLTFKSFNFYKPDSLCCNIIWNTNFYWSFRPNCPFCNEWRSTERARNIPTSELCYRLQSVVVFKTTPYLR